MIFFHGGGWQCGSGQRNFYGPDFLMEHDVIYIGANFRLGPLGFLSTGQEDCPGNNGLKDQVLILKWIQENIASFGGDPDEVTGKCSIFHEGLFETIFFVFDCFSVWRKCWRC
jgi:carboxylesterase type B